MIIDRSLFGDCFCPCPGIGRVCLRGDRNIPQTLIDLAKKIDGSDFSPSCFAIDIFPDGAKIVYMGMHEFHDLEIVCDNFIDAILHYKAFADESDADETFTEEWGDTRKPDTPAAPQPLRVCYRCLMGIESHEGQQITRKIYLDDDDPTPCDWCEEALDDILYEIL